MILHTDPFQFFSIGNKSKDSIRSEKMRIEIMPVNDGLNPKVVY